MSSNDRPHQVPYLPRLKPNILTFDPNKAPICKIGKAIQTLCEDIPGYCIDVYESETDPNWRDKTIDLISTQTVVMALIEDTGRHLSSGILYHTGLNFDFQVLEDGNGRFLVNFFLSYDRN